MIRRQRYILNARDRRLILGEQTAIMGILNVTDDSFSGDGCLKGNADVRRALRLANNMRRCGADIIDIGGESTRPGAKAISAIEECRRVIPVIEAIARTRIDCLISVDTSKEQVAMAALKAGAHMINIVQGNSLSRGLLDCIRRFNAGIVIMHMRGTPKTMRQHTMYHHLLPDIISELKDALKLIRARGISDDRIIIDPGIGFAKTAEQNFAILARLHELSKLKFPVLIGPSRKSFIGSLLNVEPSARLTGTVAAAVAGVMNGAHIVRAHDVFEIKQAIQITDAILSGAK